MLRITEQKVDLLSSRKAIENVFQRSFYGEEINDQPVERTRAVKKPNRPSVTDFRSVSTLKVIKNVKHMN
jgi:hypothetical protein